MTDFIPYELTAEKIVSLKHWLDRQEVVFPYSNDPYCSLMICYVLLQELAGPNDDLSRFIYDFDHKKKIDRHQLKVQIGTLGGQINYAIKVTCHDAGRLLVTISDLQQLMVCRDHEIIIMPDKIAAYIRERRLTPVFVKDWLQQVLFAGFDLRRDRLIEQLWVLRNNDVFLYAKTVANHQVVFQSIHDIVGHITGLDYEGFDFAANVAKMIFCKLHSYFGDEGRGNLPSHLIPFLIGLMLDDITQKPFYFSTTRSDAITEVLNALDDFQVDPHELLILKGFPGQLNEVLQLARNKTRFSIELLRAEILKLFCQCYDLIETASVIKSSFVA